MQASYQIYLLYPYYANVGKRLRKNPKIYFGDTALATYLMGIHNSDMLINSPNFGALFETAVVMDWVKRYTNHGMKPNLYFLRTADGLEVDLVVEENQKINLFEIKATMTLTPRHASQLRLWEKHLGKKAGRLGIISLIKNNEPVTGKVKGFSWLNLLSL